MSVSVLVGPFAPTSLTGGDIRVGQGPIVELPPPDTARAEEETKRLSQRRPKPRRLEDPVVGSTLLVENFNGSLREEKKEEKVCDGDGNGIASVGDEKEWVEEDTEMLKKQMLKHPVGKPRRWEVIAEAFGGRFKVETVIKKAKKLGEKKLGDADSYAQFLKKRKPMDKRIEGEIEESNGGSVMAENSGGGGVDGWSSAEDIALLNALKAFPKDVSMRWEKIATSVPGKSKPACMKRVAELKRDFRSAKAATEA